MMTSKNRFDTKEGVSRISMLWWTATFWRRFDVRWRSQQFFSKTKIIIHFQLSSEYISCVEAGNGQRIALTCINFIFYHEGKRYLRGKTLLAPRFEPMTFFFSYSSSLPPLPNSLAWLGPSWKPVLRGTKQWLLWLLHCFGHQQSNPKQSS